MDDHISVIYKNPVRVGFTFNTNGPYSALPQSGFDIVRNSLDLGDTIAGAYHKKIRDHR